MLDMVSSEIILAVIGSGDNATGSWHNKLSIV